MKKISLFALVFCTSLAAASAQCPKIINCPSAAQLFCDYSTNDPLLWNAPPLTNVPAFESNDLPEALADLSLLARDTCGDSLVVHFVLFLDLNGDDIAESAVRDEMGLAAGTMLANNANNPGYTPGDPLTFDARAVPAEEKYRFVLEKTYIADLVIARVRWATDAAPETYESPQLPNGLHRIVWTVEQGGVSKTCEYTVRVRDCAPPTVQCVSTPSFTLPNGVQPTLQVFAVDLFSSKNDNATPSNFLAISLRKEGEGTGFPLDLTGNPIGSVTFDCCDVGSQMVEVWVKDVAGNTSFCTTEILINGSSSCAPCEPALLACTATEADAPLGSIQYTLENFLSGEPPTVVAAGDSVCTFLASFTGDNYEITPRRNDNPLNGVTTYDLVLIARHILGLDTLGPYKAIAADANKSNSITSFDIIELRKLILGIYDSLPNNSSWRFVPRDFVFADVFNPFAPPLFPETALVDNWTGADDLYVHFVGLKVGDVNNSALANTLAAPPTERAAAVLNLPDLNVKMGETLEIPLRWASAGEWSGAQFELGFDPQVLEIESVAPGVLADLSRENWSQTRAGSLRFSWSGAVAQAVFPGDDLLRLRIRARSNARLSEALWLGQPGLLRPEAYDAAAERQALQLHFSQQNQPATGTAILAPQPNPTAGRARWPIRLAQAETVEIEVFDLRGQRCWRGEWSLAAGAHWLECPETAFPLAGVYTWRVRAGATLRSGRLLRL